MSNKSIATVATIGIYIRKNSFHVVGLDQRGAIVLRQKWSRSQIEARLANVPPCLIGMEACCSSVASTSPTYVGLCKRSSLLASVVSGKYWPPAMCDQSDR